MAIVGTVDQRKGCDLLVDCVQFIPAEIRDKIEIFVIGKPSDKKIVNKILRCNKIDFKMIGNVEHDKLLEIMTSIDVLLCPSIDDPMPIVCTEAMMLSKPIIASTNTGTSYIIQDGKEGFIFNSGDAKHLAKSIIKSVNNSHKLSEMGIYARQVYEKFFTMEQFYKNVEGIFLHGNE